MHRHIYLFIFLANVTESPRLYIACKFFVCRQQPPLNISQTEKNGLVHGGFLHYKYNLQHMM